MKITTTMTIETIRDKHGDWLCKIETPRVEVHCMFQDTEAEAMDQAMRELRIWLQAKEENA